MFHKFQDLARIIQNKLPIGQSLTASHVCLIAKEELEKINPQLATKVRIATYKDGKLKITSNSSTALNELKYIKNLLKDSVNTRGKAIFGKSPVDDIFYSNEQVTSAP